MKRWLLDACAIVFMLCSIAGTTAYVLQARAQQRAIGERTAPRKVADWKGYLSGGHVVGNPNSALKIAVFSDYQCPGCRQLEQRLAELASDGSDVAVTYHYLPLHSHPYAFGAALAAECASVQGKFDAMHHALFADQDSLGLVSWSQIARSAAVGDLSAFDKCMKDSSGVEQIRADLAAGRRLELLGTPSIIVNGLAYFGSQSKDTIVKWIRQAKVVNQN